MSRQEAEKQQRRERALGNPLYFGEAYLRPFDENWRSDLPPFAGEMLAFALTAKRGVVILPPEFLKTTLLSQLLPLWLTYRYTWQGKLLRGMLLGEEEGMSSANLSVVKWHIENNELLAHDFSDGQGRPLVYPDPEESTWREDAMIVNRRGTYKDPTWQAKGLDSKGIHGRRLDWLIGDDVVTPRNAFSPTYRRTALNLWDIQITTRLVRDGRALVCGNFNHSRDLVSTLAERPSYEAFRRPALHDPENPEIADTDGVPLWPENWPVERLREEQRDKPQRFRRIYLLDPRAEGGEKLNDAWMEKINPGETPMGPQTRFYIGLDGAPGGETDDLDFFNLTVLAVHPGNADICASIDIRRGLSEQVDLLGTVHDRFDRIGAGVAAIGAAKVAMDGYMRGGIIALRPELAPKLVAISTPGSKDERLEALGPNARSHWLRSWEPVWEQLTSDASDQFQELTLGEQWREFPHGKHDDKLDGLYVAIRAAREFSGERSVEVALEAI